MSEALESRKVIFVSSPYRADTPEGISSNVEKAKRYCRLVYERGCSPFAPHLHNPQFMVDSDKWMECGQAMLLRCDEMWVFHEDGITIGMKEEVLCAFRNGIAIKFAKVSAVGNSLDFDDDECAKYLNSNITHDDSTARMIILDKKEVTRLEDLAAEVFASFEYDLPSGFLRNVRMEVVKKVFDGSTFSIGRDNLVELIDCALGDDTGSRANPLFRFAKGVTNGEYGNPHAAVECTAKSSEPVVGTSFAIRRGQCCGTCKNGNGRGTGNSFVRCEKMDGQSVNVFSVCDAHELD